MSDRQALELAIVENVQRADLNPVEEARGYQALIEEFDYSQADLGETIGKSRVHVTNTLRLLKLPKAVLDAAARRAALSAGHGRALLARARPGAAGASSWSRRTCRCARPSGWRRRRRTEPRPRAEAEEGKTPTSIALEKELTDRLGMKVEIDRCGRGQGRGRRCSTAASSSSTLICRKLRCRS